MFFNIFASFLAFSTSSQKNLNFQKIFGTRLTFNALFLKSLIFLFRCDVDKKIQKNKKNQIKKKRKEKKVEGSILSPEQYFYL